MQTFDLTPDPKVLLALAHTPMQPLDALCELIDNAIDSFRTASLQGEEVKHPLVIIELPRRSELESYSGSIRIRDNGPGLSSSNAELALRAGFSGNNAYDSLGLFGMGFNIATAKLGRVTRFFTARAADDDAIEVVIDLERVRDSKSFKVPVNSVAKPVDFSSGTLVEISAWWPAGNANSGFVRKLVQYGLPKIREQIGRRYGSILRKRNVQIVINNEPCQPFEHCAWSDSRFVERKGHGRIPAVFRINEQVGSQTRCVSCTALVEPGRADCQVCKSSSLRTIEERVEGWLGIQRFDDPTEFGVDLIRNGRAIRIGEKAAFFEFTDELKKTVMDYPIDGSYGRIVGEVNINHVPVDFLKQDFQRTSPEWYRVMSYLRGDSSLQPSQPGAESNSSPTFKLYQGYRRVRNVGRSDMYMGFWDVASDGPRRISRDVEREYYRKFLDRQPGFYEDSEWWKLVENADKRPLEELVECPQCSAQNLQGHEECMSCSAVLLGKNCLSVSCAKEIPRSAATCAHCGCSQIPEILEPWACAVCGAANKSEATACSECSTSKGTLHPLDRDRLLGQSVKSDDLSIPACTVQLADGSNSSPIDVDVYVSRHPLGNAKKGKHVPIYAIKTPERIEMFVDPAHVLFKSYRIRPEQMIASEVALVVHDSNRRLSGRQNEGLHTLSTISWQILQNRWQGTLEDSSDRLRLDASALFNALREKLPAVLVHHAEDIYENMDDAAQREMVENMIARGVNVMNLADAKASGKYLLYVNELTIVNLFKEYASLFFDGRCWDEPWEDISHLSDVVVTEIRSRTKSLYLNCLDDISGYLRSNQPDLAVMQRVRASLVILQQRLS